MRHAIARHQRASSPARQQGMTLISFILIATLGVFALFLGAKILPSYSEFGKVVKIMRAVAKESEPTGASVHSIREKLSRELIFHNVRNVERRDFKIDRSRDGATLSVAYEVPIHLFGSLGLVAKFQRSIPIGTTSQREP